MLRYQNTQPESPNLSTIFVTFLKVGLFAYGGWSGAMIMIRREIIEQKRWITEDELAKSFTYSQLLPGSTAVGIISGTGYRIKGWSGLITATCAYILPPALMMTVLSMIYFHYHTIPAVSAPLNGVYAAMVGLLLANTWQLARKYNKNTFLWLLSISVLCANLFFHVGFAILVVGSALICFIYLPVDNSAKTNE